MWLRSSTFTVACAYDHCTECPVWRRVGGIHACVSLDAQLLRSVCYARRHMIAQHAYSSLAVLIPKPWMLCVLLLYSQAWIPQRRQPGSVGRA